MGRTRLLALGLALGCMGCGPGEPAKGAQSSEPSPVPSPAPPGKILYAHNKHDHLEVFDLAKGTRELQSKRNPEGPSDVGGGLHYCSTETVHCLISGLQIAVPRKYPFPATWGAYGYRCRVIAAEPRADDEVTAECILRPGLTIVYDYSKTRGIVRFWSVCRDCPEGYYELVGERGLFPSE